MADGTTASDVVVVIPFAGSIRFLCEQLDALGAQQGAEGFEVVVAVNRPADLAPTVAAVAGRSSGIRVVDASARPGPSAARNIGWRSSRRPLVLFCDADDRCDPGWVQAMSDALRRSPLVRGSLEYTSLNPVPFAFSRLDDTVHPTKFAHLPFGPSCNLGVRRALLEQLEGFDERLATGEDIDLCWRAHYSGSSLAHAPEALVAYRLRQSMAELYRQGVGYGRGGAALLELHRERGARWGARDRVRQVAGISVLAVQALFRPSGRLKLALQIGELVGGLRPLRIGIRSRHSVPVQGDRIPDIPAYASEAINSLRDSHDPSGVVQATEEVITEAR